MKKIILYITIILITAGLFAFNSPVKDNPVARNLKVEFITYNGFGNNLYIDNLTIGSRFGNDVGITAIENIAPDTSYIVGQEQQTVYPLVDFTNFGKNSVTNLNIIINITPGNYTDSFTDSTLPAGATDYHYFKIYDITPGTPFTIQVFTNLSNDTNSTNDTITQTSLILTGARRNVLLEEFTSTTSPSCAYNNPAINSFVNNYFNNITAVKYHIGIPPPGNDSMYLFNPVEADARKSYYRINSVPTVLMDGKNNVTVPYTIDSNLIRAYNLRYETATPVNLTATDTLLAGDTVQCSITLINLHNLPAGNYKLRVMAVERLILDSVLYGNGESFFYDVFRKAYPDTNGISAAQNRGTYQFTYKYHIDTQWNDTMIYTVAFVQNDNTREILNSSKGKTIIAEAVRPPFLNTLQNNYKPDFVKTDFYSRKYFPPVFTIDNDTISEMFSSEIFEGIFPPGGWTLANPDGWLTFSKVTNVNGINLGGWSCVKCDFYEYTDIGQNDTLISKNFTGVTSADTLSFDYSYAQYLSEYSDSLRVNISTDGGASWVTIFNEGGYRLATAEATTLPFEPYSTSQWKTFSIPLRGIIPPDNTNSNLPVKYELEQNYPNPFNPSTLIKFAIKDAVLVTLKVYDITGREIATLINSKLSPSTVMVRFSAGEYNLSSGVYFYRLVAGDYTESRKMMYLK